SSDLAGEMHRLAALLEITIPDETRPQLVQSATFECMRTRADRLAPDVSGVLKDGRAFFRRGTSGSARELLTAEEFDHYLARAAELAPPDLLTWLHRRGSSQNCGVSE